MRSSPAMILATVAAVARAQIPVHYGGDWGDNCFSSERNTLVSDARIYDDFKLEHAATIHGLWGNYILFDLRPEQAYWEIREGVRRGDGGRLVASGTDFVTVRQTGRRSRYWDEQNIQVKLSLPLTLPPGVYHMTIAPIGKGLGRAFVCNTFGEDGVSTGDPNPPPIGGLVRNGNAFFDSRFFGEEWLPFEEMYGYLGARDLSYGIGMIPSVARTPDGIELRSGSVVSGDIDSLRHRDSNRLRLASSDTAGEVDVIFDLAPPVDGTSRVYTLIDYRFNDPWYLFHLQVLGFDFIRREWRELDFRKSLGSREKTVGAVAFDPDSPFISGGRSRLRLVARTNGRPWTVDVGLVRQEYQYP